ncbi:hypothetical protein [Chitinophaga barathri]|uniref:Uncharacterized protein n=1 Tax=Chitinophaga barathri TaxID=1647451 RepID=A0A3N4M6R9_9BACT|nr:hypothetical protein [Chitinophaga barathri]RPD39104.1 hypothetical protein EG028_21050 [Chitinophaga barathri]
MKKDMQEHDYTFDTVEAIVKFQRFIYLQKIAIIKKGITKNQLDQFKNVTGLHYSVIAKLMNITERYLHKKKGHDRFRPQMSDAIIALIDLYGYGYDHFNDPPTFNQWIKTGCPEKKYVPPLTYCDTIPGKEEVKREIFRIAHKEPTLYQWVKAGEA